MEDKIRETHREELMISIEEFDALEDGPEGAHEFTGEYKRKKEKMLKEYKRRVCQSVWIGWAKAAAAVITYPKREYTDEGLEKAEELMGNGVSYQPLIKEIGDTRLTVLGAAYDGKSAVVEFTLER